MLTCWTPAHFTILVFQNMKRYQNMQSDRKNLPAWSMQDEILATIEQNQVVVISGMTGYVH